MPEASLIGHNQPPPLTPLEALQVHIGDLAETARGCLTGTPIATAEQAAQVQSLVSDARKAKDTADKARKADPVYIAGKALDAAYKPLTDDAERIRLAGLAALTIWNVAVENAQREAAAEAQRIADDAADAARIIAATTDTANLEAVEQREQAIKASASAAMDAVRAGKARAVASSGEGRGIGLRSYHTATLADPLAFGKWLWAHRNADYLEWLMEWADREVKSQKCNLPGVIANETRRAA